MRTLTKTGIRILSAKYRSILIKCAIINASVFIGAFGAGSAMAEGMTWNQLKSAIEIDTAETINITNDIKSTILGESGNITISREVSIVGDSDGRYLSGNNTHSGFTVGTDGNLTLENITMQNFKSDLGGAIYNDHGTITGITGNFKNNSATDEYGGAIANNGGTIINITGDFNGNHTDNGAGGAIYNYYGTIENITGNFENNYASDDDGGAINNIGKSSNISNIAIKTSTNDVLFKNNHAKGKGGAINNDINSTLKIIADNGNITFDGNYVTSSNGKGGAIYNYSNDTLGLCAKENKSITFIGISNVDNANDVDGIYNAGNLNINGDGTITPYKGTVNLYNVDGTGTTNIYGGKVFVNNNFKQNILGIIGSSRVAMRKNLDISDLTVSNNSQLIVDDKLVVHDGGININKQSFLKTEDLEINNDAIISLDSSILQLGKNAVDRTSTNAIPEIYMKNSTLNLQNNSIGIMNIKTFNLLPGTDNHLLIDADLANAKMDQIENHGGSVNGSMIISDIRLLSDSKENILTLDLFTDEFMQGEYVSTKKVLKDKIFGNLTGLKYGPIYVYNADYNPADGKVTFTRTEQPNPYIYAPSVVANTTAAMTTQIATLAMDKMDDVVHAQGRSGGDTPSSSNVWVKVMGLNDNVEFNNFENVDSKAMTVTAGYNTNKITCGDCGIVFGAYAGYIGGKQQYTANDIDQDGGYIGLSSALTLGDAFLTATVNGGLLKNKANNMYGTDRFNTLWLGTGLKAGYNYAITDSVVLQPNVYGGYTLVNTKDYTSVSGVKIATNNLNFFEIDPGLKLSAVIADGWTGSVQGKYAIVMDNGADITANDFALQNISTKNYIEYGIGIDKSVTDAFYLGAKINRHDGGRTGWNGSIECKYKF